MKSVVFVISEVVCVAGEVAIGRVIDIVFIVDSVWVFFDSVVSIVGEQQSVPCAFLPFIFV